MTRDGDRIRELCRVIKEECKTRKITIQDAMDKFADRTKHMNKTAQEAAREAKAKADLDARHAEIAAEESYQTQLQEAREKGDLKTVAKLERAHQLVKNKQLQEEKKAREGKAFWGKQPPQRKAAGSSGSTTQPPP